MARDLIRNQNLLSESIRKELLALKENVSSIISILINQIDSPMSEDFDEWMEKEKFYDLELVLKCVLSNMVQLHASSELIIQAYNFVRKEEDVI